jgi:hypothetical protein
MRQGAQQNVLREILGLDGVAGLAFEVLYQRRAHVRHEAGIVQRIAQ